MVKKSGKSGTPRQAAASSKLKTAKSKVKPASSLPASQSPARLPNAWRLTEMAARLLWRHKRLFIGITLVYGLLSVVLVQGLSGNSDISTLKGTVTQAFHGHFSGWGSGLASFVVLLGSAGGGSNSDQTSSAYQLFLLLLASLAIIWALRQVLSGATIRVRDAYYRGMYPLVPFVLVFLVIGIQLLPLVIGSAIYATITTNGIAVHFVEQLFWLAVFLLFAAVSLYLICSSVFALYIVTLPDMTPMKALRSARQLVRHRRLAVLRKLLWLPLVLLVAAAVIMLPFIVWLTPLAQWIFFLLTILGLAAVHTYLYRLYRELLNE